jgi:hypothetical protein
MAPTQKKPPKTPKSYLEDRPTGEGAIRISPYWGNDTMTGGSTVTVSFEDPGWELIETGFFDANEDGKLDSIAVNYPAGSDLYWRCTQIGIQANRANASIEMVFMERTVAYLLSKHGPVKTSRAKRTRAEFLAGLVSQVKAAKLEFHCQQLSVAQEQEKDRRKKKKDDDKTRRPVDQAGHPAGAVVAPTDPTRKAKTKGISKKSDVTIKGAKPDDEQLKAIKTCMHVADKLKVSPKALKAMVVAGIGESSFRPSAGETIYGTHKGVFQSNQIPQFDTEAQCTHFLQGGRSFLAGGAIGLAKSHPEYSVGTIASKVEISDGQGSYYDGFAGEADKIISAYGGAGSDDDTGTEYRKSYNFEVGGPDHPHETYWDAMQRLAQEVNWALFADGNSVFYDAETTLIRQVPAAYINRLDEAVVSFNANWDNRMIATEATLELICDPFEFRAGDVLKLEGFGPASTGSPVKLPGRWLIDEVDRDRFEFVSTFRLKQPTDPKREPAPDTGSRDESDDKDDKTVSGAAKDLVEWAKDQVGTTEGSAKQQKWANELGYSASLPWCSIFIGYGMKHTTKLPLPGNPAYSGAWLQWSGGSRVNKSSIKPGDIVVFDWGDGGQTDHVALYVGDGDVIGGNQSNKVSRVPWNKAKTVGVVSPHYAEAETDSRSSVPKLATNASGKVMQQ